jgi:hypothetical protein
MAQVIRTESPDNSATNAILMVLVLAAIVAFGVWFFGQGAIPAADTTDNNGGLNVDVNLPAGGTGNNNGGNPAPTTPGQ